MPRLTVSLPEERSVDSARSSVPSYPEEMDTIFFLTVVCLLTLKNRNVNNESLRDIFLFYFSFASFFFQTSENNLWTGLVFSPLAYTFPVSQPHFFSIRSHHQL